MNEYHTRHVKICFIETTRTFQQQIANLYVIEWCSACVTAVAQIGGWGKCTRKDCETFISDAIHEKGTHSPKSRSPLLSASKSENIRLPMGLLNLLNRSYIYKELSLSTVLRLLPRLYTHGLEGKIVEKFLY